MLPGVNRRSKMLAACYECQHRVSTSAVRCPKCGAKLGSYVKGPSCERVVKCTACNGTGNVVLRAERWFNPRISFNCKVCAGAGVHKDRDGTCSYAAGPGLYRARDHHDLASERPPKLLRRLPRPASPKNDP